MKDERGRPIDVFVVSGKMVPPYSSHVQLTLILRTGEEVRKVEVATTVLLEERLVTGGSTEKDFEERWPTIQEASLLLAEGNRSVGKLFLREAIDAYKACEKLRPDQIAEAMAGAFLVDRVERL